MKLSTKIQVKQTVRLFNGKYKYKIVLISKAASWFRGGVKNAKVNIGQKHLQPAWRDRLTSADLDLAEKLMVKMTPMTDYLIRVESPYINFYTNTESDVENLAKINPSIVKYVCAPVQGSEAELDLKKIIVKTLDFKYRITMGKTDKNYTNFVEWAEGKSDKIRLPKRAQRMLVKDRSWGGYYFYVKDDKLLTMVKMFLGGDIQCVEQCVKA